MEAYLIDYQGDLHGHEIKIDMVARLRDEQKFNTADELKRQVAEDIEHGKAILNTAFGKKS